jgi:hypothetical protein
MKIIATAVIDYNGNLHTLNDNTSHGDLVDHLLRIGVLQYRSYVVERGFMLEDNTFCSRRKAAKFFNKSSGSLVYSSDLK